MGLFFDHTIALKGEIQQLRRPSNYYRSKLKLFVEIARGCTLLLGEHDVCVFALSSGRLVCPERHDFQRVRGDIELELVSPSVHGEIRERRESKFHSLQVLNTTWIAILAVFERFSEPT